ncbi:hypothetical protein [Streptomyces griseorubiginosus]|nr:hypothetical protein [Streptomyces griseorubiginosus]
MPEEQVDGARRDVASAEIMTLATEVASSVIGASVALQGSPMAAILGVASVPVIQRASARVLDRRAKHFGARLRRKGVSTEQVLTAIVEVPEAFDLFRSALTAAMATDDAAKRALLADVMASGVLSADEATKAYARRVVTSLSRIDSLEILVLGTLDQISSEVSASKVPGAVTRRDLMHAFTSARPEMMDAGLAVLRAEGLASAVDGSNSWRISDYGRRIITEIRSVNSDPDGLDGD